MSGVVEGYNLFRQGMPKETTGLRGHTTEIMHARSTHSRILLRVKAKPSSLLMMSLYKVSA